LRLLKEEKLLGRESPLLVLGFAKTMLKRSCKPMLAALLAFLAVAAATAAAAEAPASQSLIFEGPGGRVPLTEWTLRRDAPDRGLALGWAKGTFSGSVVRVPNVVNPRPYQGRAGGTNYQGSVAWYRTTFMAPSAGLYQLSFQSANYKAEVFVDGRLLGSHRGSYLPFQLQRQLSAGTHTVVVRVDWRFPGQQAKEGFHRTWFNWGGLDGEVDVRHIGQSDLTNPTIATTLSPSGQASVKVTVQVKNYGTERQLQPEGSLTHAGQSVRLAFPALVLAGGETATASATVKIADPALWSPSSPNLYQLSLAVPGESSYAARVGLRQITWHGQEVLLNGTRLKLHGATIQEDAMGHGDALTPGDQDRLVEELKQIGANVVRAQHPLDPALLERLDAAGLLVWQGVGPVEGAGMWYSTTPKLLAEAEAQVQTAATAASLHPSIFAWNLVDEVADNGRDEAEVRYVRDSARWLHQHDPTRMVAVDVWGTHPPKVAGPLYSEVDAVAETDYTGWYEGPRDSQTELVSKMRMRLAVMERTFPNKVLVISEFGAESNTLNKPGSPGSYAFQSKFLQTHIDVYATDPHISAMMVWVLRDYPLTPSFSGGSVRKLLPHLKLIEGLNQKGLFTYAGVAKPAAATGGRLFKALPAE
jgi:hypothetical protein